MKAMQSEGRRRRADRQSHHAAARRRRRRRRRDAHASSSRTCNSPFGMALIGATCTSRTPMRSCAFRIKTGDTQHHRRRERRSPICPAARSTITGPRTSSPAADGTKLYATVGSNSNVGENGMDAEEGPRRDLGDRSRRPARSGCSPPACAIPTAWPGSRDRRAVDRGQRARRARQRSRARLPDLGEGRRLLRLALQLLRPARRRARRAAAPRPRGEGDPARLRAGRARGARSASRSPTARRCRRRFTNGMFVGEHGSWNRKPPAGYNVVFVPFANGQPRARRSTC